MSYVSYAKLARNIRLELTLPVSERSQHGSTMVDICGTEYGRLIEQSPSLPTSVIREFENVFGVSVKQKGFSRPEFLGIKLINPFRGTKEKNILDEAVNVLEAKSLREQKMVTTKFQSAKDSVLEELRRLREPRTPRSNETVVTVEQIVPSHSANLSKLSKLFDLEDEPS